MIFIAFAQLDLLLFRLGSDLVANAVTLNFYLDGKIYDPEMHVRRNNQAEERERMQNNAANNKETAEQNEQEEDIDGDHMHNKNKRDNNSSDHQKKTSLRLTLMRANKQEEHEILEVASDDKARLLATQT